MVSPLYIIKSDGEQELFDLEKLRASLRRSGASTVLANEISDTVAKNISNKSTTDNVYKEAFNLLKKQEHKTALRYSLKRSLFSLGPTGFPFEKYVAKLLEKKGYKTQNDVILNGKCTTHELDIIAYDDDDLIMIEAKFHNDLSTITDTKVALYVKARFDDLKTQEFDIDGRKRKLTNGILLTNTKFTSTAIDYAKCAGLELISWDYPEKGNLYDLIEPSGLYPLTCITTLSKKDKEKLISAGVIDLTEIDANINLLKDIGIPDSKISDLVKEVSIICRT